MPKKRITENFKHTKSFRVASTSKILAEPLAVPPLPLTMPDDTSNEVRVKILKSNLDEWDKIITQITEQYGIDFAKKLADAIGPQLKSALATVNLDSATGSGGYTFDSKADFEPTHVEMLLNTAADLFDRAIAEASEHDRLRGEGFHVALDVLEHASITAVLEDELRAGRFDLPHIQHNSEADSETSTKIGLREAEQKIASELAKLRGADGKEFIDALRRAAYISPMPHFYGDEPLHNPYTKYTLQGGAPLYADDLMKHEMKKVSGLEGDFAQKSEQLMESAGIQARHELRQQEVVLTSQQLIDASGAKMAESREQSQRKHAEFYLKDVGFQTRRAQIARSLADLASEAAVAPAGPLNYAERLLPLCQRIERDARDAVARMEAAYDGLKSVYGYAGPKLPSRKKPSTIQGTERYIQECVMWVRDAIAWLTKQLQLEQSYVLPISVKASGADLNSDPQKGWREWKIVIKAGLFESQKSIRLRGISAIVTGKDRIAGFWRVKVTAPGQSHTCMLGRVGTVDMFREADVCGELILHNVNPVGDWTVSMIDKSSAGEPFSKVLDLHLQLHVATL